MPGKFFDYLVDRPDERVRRRKNVGGGTVALAHRWVGR
jgi:hypothetical protein